ncbi:glycine zipper 2TM domain-containing protein [Altererythrobacter xixiisoli]|uniref:17 kDa surface antigen n=1 Tax=Croceibacterium xixiisoli TaxID=1476466 RepID=A0A6I4TMZ4_9SPHN|nr:glycine zipper 2TM domain-containing protein [Croceibacterium xixiisoli]MXO97425.1 glycine zipper 2TM domain-containing protein [Croceibacterium xixiisoli]
MTNRSLPLLTAASLLLAASPALANDPTPAPYPAETQAQAQDGEWVGEWNGSWDDRDSYRGVWTGSYVGADGEEYDAEYRGVFHGQRRFVSEDGQHELYREGDRRWRERAPRGARRLHGDVGYRNDGHGARYGYSPDARADWIDACRANYGDADYDNGRRSNGGVIGGVVGAVAGGVIGNRVGGRGNRLAGTAIGAGVGGVAGAVAGDAIDRGNRRRDDERRYDECEDYLYRYEQGAYSYGQPGYGHQAYGYGYGYPVMMVPVPITTTYRYSAPREYIVEDIEIVEEEVIEERPAARPAPRRTIRRVMPDKRVPIR